MCVQTQELNVYLAESCVEFLPIRRLPQNIYLCTKHLKYSQLCICPSYRGGANKFLLGGTVTGLAMTGGGGWGEAENLREFRQHVNTNDDALYQDI